MARRLSGSLSPRSTNLQKVRFSADSQCPNFPDAEEGVYRSSGDGLVLDASGVEGDLSIPQRNTGRACFDGEFMIHLAGSLYDGSKELVINPTVLTVRGDFLSEARDEACPTF